MNAPVAERRRLSARMSVRMSGLPKPRVRRTAISVTRSRAAIAIVFAEMRRMTRTIAVEMPMTTALTFPSIETKPFWNSFSVSVFVGDEEFSNSASTARGSCCAASADSALIQNVPTWPFAKGSASSTALRSK